MDKDNSGTLKKEEMFHSFSRLWQVFPGLREALKGIDSMIDVQKKSSHVDILVQEVFDQFDSDSSGIVMLRHCVCYNDGGEEGETRRKRQTGE